MRINHNIAALNTYNKLSSNQATTAKSLEKLSSGLKINKAGDNAAGLAISEKMRGQIRGLDQASTNASDAISLINTAEGALSETHSILQRMRELAVQSSNDTNVTVDRGEIQKEMNQLTNEINRIGNTTEFNTKKLLNGGGASITAMDTTTTTAGGKAGQVGTITLANPSSTGKSVASFAVSGGNTVTIEAASGNNLSGMTIKFVAATNGDGVEISGTGGLITIGVESGETISGIQAAIDASSVFAGFGGAKLSITTSAGDALAQNQTLLAAGDAAITALSGATATAQSFTAATGTSSRGIYTFDVKEAFVTDGDTFTLTLANGDTPDSKETITLRAASGGTSAGAAANSGDFKISNAAGDRYTAEQQATEIATALKNGIWNLGGAASGGYDTIASGYDITTNGSQVILTEKVALGAGAAITAAAGTSTPKAAVNTYVHEDVVDVGGSIIIDDVEISVVDGTGDKDNENIAAGKAILKSATSGITTDEQIAFLSLAIDRNSELSQKYATTGTTSSTLMLTQKSGSETSVAPTIELSNKVGQKFEANFQIGANSNQSMTIEVDDMRSAALKVSSRTTGTVEDKEKTVTASYVATKDVTDGTTNTGTEYALDVSTHEKATAAISIINDAIQTVSAERSKLGSFQNRLEHTINNLSTSAENMTTAESRIRDVDMAKEMMEFTKNNILSQAAQSMLAQANQQPQGVLQLLQ